MRSKNSSAQCVCVHCGESFSLSPSDVARGAQFCSRRCKYAHGSPLRRSVSERFWQGVPDRNAEGCWLWGGGSHSRGGYGQVAHQYAHRVSWVLHFGAIPEGMEVCHRCDANYPPGDTTYRRCVRPDHLFLGTHADNMADMRAKGRSSGGTHPKGEQNPCSRLSDQQTREIVSRHAAGGTTQARLAEHYGVGRTTIWRVLQGIRRVLQGIR